MTRSFFGRYADHGVVYRAAARADFSTDAAAERASGSDGLQPDAAYPTEFDGQPVRLHQSLGLCVLQ